MSGWLQTWLGHAVDYADPRPKQLDVYDIGHHLSRINRFNGALYPEHYTVAEHSVHVAQLVKLRGESVEVQRAALMHDAAEAYCGDVVSPLKRMPELEGYRQILETMELAIAERFALPPELPEPVKRADIDMLVLERNMMHSTPPRDWDLPESARIAEGIVIQMWTPNQAKIEFLLAARNLGVC